MSKKQFDSIFNKHKKIQIALNAHNKIWQQKINTYQQYSQTPPWFPNQTINNQLRQQYQQYMPIKIFCQALYQLATQILPNPNWIPTILLSPHNTPPPLPTICLPKSLPDFWQQLPTSLQSKTTFNLNTIIKLYCTLADPAKFGTTINRYPKQLTMIKQWLQKTATTKLTMIDFACGTGHGTYEIIAIAKQLNITKIDAIGITREMLEVWMAKKLYIPHNHARSKQLQQYKQLTKNIIFEQGDILNYQYTAKQLKNYNLIICNGLIAGRFMNKQKQYKKILKLFTKLITPNGLITIANNFHAGTNKQLKQFIKIAQQNWQITIQQNFINLTPNS